MPGAFGDVAALDVILNGHHDRGRGPLLRTGGAGLVLEDSAAALTMIAELPNTRDADDTLDAGSDGCATRACRSSSGRLSEHMEAGMTRMRVIDRARFGVTVGSGRQARISRIRYRGAAARPTGAHGSGAGFSMASNVVCECLTGGLQPGSVPARGARTPRRSGCARRVGHDRASNRGGRIDRGRDPEIHQQTGSSQRGS